MKTIVNVEIGSEVSAQVLPNASNTVVATSASSTDVSFWSSIIEWIIQLIS